jgi:hypothetical protein
MLVEKTAVELAGYLSADEAGAGFVIPLFTGRSSNMVLVQEIGADGRVSHFREVEPRNFQRLGSAGRLLSEGQPALWGFRCSDGKAVIDEREALRTFLSSLLDTLEPPFLKLQVAQFCEDLDELVDAWRTAFEHLDERSPKSARAWRDVVVIPAQMRLAVERAILEHGLDASINELARTVEVAIHDGALQLYLSSDLHAALMGHGGARNSLERNAAPIRRAFRLSAQRIALIAKGAAPPSDIEADLPDEVAIAGFGDMAFSLLGQLVPRIRRSPEGYSHAYPAPRGIKELVLLQRDELSGKADWGTGGPPPALDEHNRVLLVTFQLSAAHPQLADAAIAFAKQHRSKRRTVVAVIPHLPHEFDDGGELSESVIPTLNYHFDAVWALSDRSPYTRQALPFGPARSVRASATHFRYLLRLAQHEDLRHELLADARNPATLNVIGSATGDRTAATLTEHAMMRLAHHLFDLKTVTSAEVSGGSRAEPSGKARDIVQRDCPRAKVRTRSVARGDGGPDRISVALKNVTIVPGGPEKFERYCAAQLERFGWDIDQFEPDGALHLSHRDLDNVPADCKYIVSGLLETAIRSRLRRRYDLDAILLTNASIRRRSFALHVLNGAVPVHSSRIEALHRIYRRRHVYVLTFLQQERQTGERMIVPAAIDWLNLHHWVDSKNIGKAKLAVDARVETMFSPQSITLTIPLEFVRGRGRRATAMEAEARIAFDEDGWHLDEVSADGVVLQRS